MKTKIIEATNGQKNWGKFLIGRLDVEWEREVKVIGGEGGKLLQAMGTERTTLWVLDLQTGEGARFKPGGLAAADLDKHRIWVCPMFEPFLVWLYAQDLADLDKLPDAIDLPDAEFALAGYRRKGP